MLYAMQTTMPIIIVDEIPFRPDIENVTGNKFIARIHPIRIHPIRIFVVHDGHDND